MDIAQLFTQNFDRVRKEDQARHFLIKVEAVQFAEGKTDTFRAIGIRHDNGARVAVISTRERSGQHLPEVGGMLRAEKAAPLPASPNRPDIAFYKAKYFHAYGANEFCLKAVIQPSPAVKNEDTGMWGAQVHAFDLESNVESITADKLLAGDEFERAVLKVLKPWSAEHASAITHDVRGNALWGDGQTAMPGLSPFAVIRFAGQTVKVYGLPAVKEFKGGQERLRLPTDAEILSRLASNPRLQSIKSTARQIPPEKAKELALLPIHIIPGLSIQVGRDSLAEDNETYLRLPETFKFQGKDTEGRPTERRGYVLADVHVKASRKDRMMVAHAVPSPGARLSRTIPETKQEREFAARLAEQAQPSNQADAAPAPAPRAQQAQAPAPEATARRPAPAPAKQSEPQFNDMDLGVAGAPASQAPAKASTRAPAPAAEAEPVFDNMEGEFDMADDDYLSYADDIAAMERMNMSDDAFDDSGVDDLLNEASQRQAERRSRPSM